MKVTEIVRQHIDKCKEREPIFVQDVEVPKKHVNARNVAFYRLEKEKKVRHYEQGIYYKPKVTMFGELGVDQDQIIERKFIKKRKDTIGYVTGPKLWNNWDITTQVPNRVWIATNEATRNREIDNFGVKLVKPKVKIEKDNYMILQFLDVIDQMEQIQDIDFKRLLDVLNDKLKTFEMQQVAFLIEYAKAYKKFVRNFTGAIIENLFEGTPEYNEIKCFVNIEKQKANYGKKINFFTNINLLKNLKEWGFYH